MFKYFPLAHAAALTIVLVSTPASSRADFTGYYALIQGPGAPFNIPPGTQGAITDPRLLNWSWRYHADPNAFGMTSLDTFSVPNSVLLTVDNTVNAPVPGSPFVQGEFVIPSVQATLSILAAEDATVVIHANAAANAFAFDNQTYINLSTGGDATLNVTAGEEFGFGVIAMTLGAPTVSGIPASPVGSATVTLTFQPVPEALPSAAGMAAVLGLALACNRRFRR